MNEPSEAASKAARLLWRDVSLGATSPEEIAVAVDRVCAQVRSGLDRWIGRPGYRSLMERSLRATLVEHPSLRTLSFDEGDEAATKAAVKHYGASEVVAGVTMLLANVIELLGRLVGQRMATRLVDHWGDRARLDLADDDAEEALDG